MRTDEKLSRSSSTSGACGNRSLLSSADGLVTPQYHCTRTPRSEGYHVSVSAFELVSFTDDDDGKKPTVHSSAPVRTEVTWHTRSPTST